MTESALRPELEPLPARMRHLPIDPTRGYIVPWFVSWVDGVPEFRAMDPKKWVMAIKEKRCWVCGGPLGQFLSFVIGPMCGINRTTSEPPCHLECAIWSAKNCPFLSRPHMVRREGGLPDDVVEASGIPLNRNPGVTLVWTTRSFRTFRAGEAAMPLIELGPPTNVQWFAEGRTATRAEVEVSIAGGLPALEAVAIAQDQAEGNTLSTVALREAVQKFVPLWPELAKDEVLHCGRCFEEVDALFEALCAPPATTPNGQYHCPDCGAMLVADVPHFKVCLRCRDRVHPTFDAAGMEKQS